MNILIITDYYPPSKVGGVGEIAKNLKAAYEQHGHQTYVLTTGKINETNVISKHRNMFLGILWNNFVALKLIRKYQIDLIHLHQASSTLFLLLKFLKKFPTVISTLQVTYFSEFREIRSVKVADQEFKPLFKEYLEKFIFAPLHIILDGIGFFCADIVTVVSQANLQEIQRTYGRFGHKKIAVIPNGVVVQPIAHKPNNNKIKTILYAGVFRVRKRVFNLIYALAQVVKIFPQAQLLVLGGGRGYEEPLRQLVENLNLQQNVIFKGKVANEQVKQHLLEADIFCLLSAYEGMPVAVLEAMSAGKAVVTTKVSGMRDLIKHDHDGKLVRVDDIAQTASEILDLLENPEKITLFGSRARNKILANYTWEKVAQTYLDLVQKII